jgi:hypothetical protein
LSDEAPAISGLSVLAIDCADPPMLAGWWRRLLGGRVEVDADGDATLHTPEGLPIDFLRVPDTKTVKNRLHLDLRPVGGSHQAEVERLIGLGARPADIGQGEVPWVVMADPEGNEFRVLGSLEAVT